MRPAIGRPQGNLLPGARDSGVAARSAIHRHGTPDRSTPTSRQQRPVAHSTKPRVSSCKKTRQMYATRPDPKFAESLAHRSRVAPSYTSPIATKKQLVRRRALAETRRYTTHYRRAQDFSLCWPRKRRGPECRERDEEAATERSDALEAATPAVANNVRRTQAQGLDVERDATTPCCEIELGNVRDPLRSRRASDIDGVRKT